MVGGGGEGCIVPHKRSSGTVYKHIRFYKGKKKIPTPKRTIYLTDLTASRGNIEREIHMGDVLVVFFCHDIFSNRKKRSKEHLTHVKNIPHLYQQQTGTIKISE